MATRWIRRFSTVQQWVHWIYAFSFLLLAITGSFLFVPLFRAFATGIAGEASRFLHRVGAVGAIVAVLMYLIFGYRDLVADLREILPWTREDFKWLVGAATRYYWGGEKGDLPNEGRYNAGQKLNYRIQIVGFFVLLVTGLIMWFGAGRVSPGIFQASIILHDIASVFVIGFFLLHLYLTTLHPMTKESITAMITGKVTEEYVKSHHPKWYQQQVTGKQ